jgi:hypothetical protein
MDPCPSTVAAAPTARTWRSPDIKSISFISCVDHRYDADEEDEREEKESLDTKGSVLIFGSTPFVFDRVGRGEGGVERQVWTQSQ